MSETIDQLLRLILDRGGATTAAELILAGEVRRLLAGCDFTPKPVDAYPTHGQWLTTLLAADEARRLKIAEIVLENSATAHRCWVLDHEGYIADLERSLTEMRTCA